MNKPESTENCSDSNITQINKNIVNGVHYPSEFAARLARDALEAAERYYNLFFQTHPTSTCTCANTQSNNNDNSNNELISNFNNPKKNGDITETTGTQDEITKVTTSKLNTNVNKHVKDNISHILSVKEEEERKREEEEEEEEEEEWKHVKNVPRRVTPTVKEKMKLNDLNTNRENETHFNELIARFVTPPPPPSLPSPLSSSLSRSMRAFDAAAATRTPKRPQPEKLEHEHEQQLEEEQEKEKNLHDKRMTSMEHSSNNSSTKEKSLLSTTLPTPYTENQNAHETIHNEVKEEKEEEEQKEKTQTHHLLDEGQDQNNKVVYKSQTDNASNMKDARKLYQGNLGMKYNIEIDKSPTQYSASSMVHTPLNVENTQYHTFFPPILSHRRREEIIREILGHAPCSYERWHWKRAFDFHHLHINIERSNSLYQPHHHPLLTGQVRQSVTHEPQKELELLEFPQQHYYNSNNDELNKENITSANNTTNRAEEISSVNTVHNDKNKNNKIKKKKQQYTQLASLFNAPSTSVELRRNSPIAPRHSLLGPRQSPVSAEPPQYTFPHPSQQSNLSHRYRQDVLVHDPIAKNNEHTTTTTTNNNNNDGTTMPSAVHSFTKASSSAASPSPITESETENYVNKKETTASEPNNNINANTELEHEIQERNKKEFTMNNSTSSNNKNDVENASFYTFPTSRQGPEYFHATAEDGTKTLIIIMVGLPARGKTFLAQKICRLLNWHGSRAKVHNLQVMWRRLLLNEMNEIHGLLHEHEELEEEYEEEKTLSHHIHDTINNHVEEEKCKTEKASHVDPMSKHNHKELHVHKDIEHPSIKHSSSSSIPEEQELLNVKTKCIHPEESKENVNDVGGIQSKINKSKSINSSSMKSHHTSHIDIEHSTISSAPSNYVCTKHFEDLILHPESSSRLLYLHVLESVAEDCRQFFLHGGEVVVINDDFVSENLRLAAEELLKPLATQLIYMEVMRDATANAHFDVLKVQDPSEYPPSSVAAMHAMNDFKARVKFLESVYEPLGPATNTTNNKINRKCCVLPTHTIEVNTPQDRSYIRVLNPDIVEAHGIRGYAASRIISYVMNLSQSKIQHPIYFLRHGESCYNPEDRIGGDPLLTEQGMRDAAALLEFLYSLKQHLRHVASSSHKPHKLKCLSHKEKEPLEEEQHHLHSKHYDVHGHANFTIDESNNNTSSSKYNEKINDDSSNNNNSTNSSEELEIWTSQLRRAIQTAELSERLLNIRTLRWSSLNEIHAGVCEGMSYEDVKECYPLIDHFRKQSKYTFRYPDGESYQDLVVRLEPVIMELENANKVIVVVAHQAVLRCLLAYFGSTSAESSVQVKVPHRTVWRCSYDSKGIASLDELYLDNTEVGFHLNKPVHKVQDNMNNNKKEISQKEKLNSKY